MSKIIKVIDLCNMIEKCDFPSRIEVLGHKFKWDCLEGFYKEEIDGSDLFEMTNSYPTYEFLDFEVKIEDKKEQPKIDIQGIKEVGIEDIANIDGYALDRIKNKINKLIKAIKQLDCQINGDKQSIKRR